MRFLRTNTAVIVTVGPFLDKTDGVTLKTALTITNEKITLTADTDAGSAPTNILDNVTGATSGTANDLNYVTGNDAAMMQLELAAADVNRLGRMFLVITDAANHCPVFHEFMVLPAVVYDAMVLGTDLFDVSMTQILGTAVSTPTVAGVPNVNVKTWNDLTTVALPLVPATAGRTLVVDASGLADANAVKVGPTGSGTAQTARDIGASVLLSAGTGTGQLDFTSGVVKANLAQILGTALTETAGLLAGGFKKFFNIASPVSTMDVVATVTNVTNAPTAGDLTATMKTSVTTAATAATPTAAAVTGAVGSVTGSVGGNVAGSIGSLATQAKADVKTEVANALTVDLLADSVHADGTRPTFAQAVYEIIQHLTERSVSGTTVTIKKVDGSTTLCTLTINDATTPTSITRS